MNLYPRSLLLAFAFMFALGMETVFQLQTQAAEISSQKLSKVLENYSGQVWVPSLWNKTLGVVSIDKNQAPDAISGNSLKVEAYFTGNGEFAFHSVNPPKPLYIPGNLQTVTLRLKRSDARFSPRITFIDGWGRLKADGKELLWDPKMDQGNDWQTFTFDVPKEWVRPIGIDGVTVHNFSVKGEKLTATYWLDDIEVTTDISGVDPATGLLKGWTPEPNPEDKNKALANAPVTPLRTVKLFTPELANIYMSNDAQVVLDMHNWSSEAMKGKATFSVVDQAGTKIKDWEEAFSVESSLVFRYPVEAKRYGLYSVQASVMLADGTTFKEKMAFAKVPVQQELTETQKMASPYGLNYHGGGRRIFEAFKKSGIMWYRDYSFGLESLLRAKGSNRKYDGWPNYPLILADYEKNGLIVLPVLLGAIKVPFKQDGAASVLGPNQEWVQTISDVILSFPNVRYWELDNEYDLTSEKYNEERTVRWENYHAYHRKFGELLDLLGDGKLTAVEQGRAGMYPIFVEAAVKSGAFNKIGVVNSHHYTGTFAPELNKENFNTGGVRLPEGMRPGFFFDSLRAVKRAAMSDGKKRESWLTEFGWDTLAGPVVTPEQQAVYLQRGFLLSFAAGTDKAFWFYNFDIEKEKAQRFFDGCGLMTFDLQPKLSFVAMAGLTSILPRPLYVGSINAGPNTWGYVFSNDGELVAGLWTIEGDKGPQVTFKAKQLYDYLGNKLSGNSAALKMAPVYAVGLEKSDPLFLQTAYGIDSNHLIVGTAGDPLTTKLRIQNNRAQEINAQIIINLPKGWTSKYPETSVSVPAGQTQEVQLTYQVGANQPVECIEVPISMMEGGSVVKTMMQTVEVKKPFVLRVDPIQGNPSKTSVGVTLENRTALSQSGTISLKLPKSWQTISREFSVSELKPSESRKIRVEFEWKPEWEKMESAMVTFVSVNGIEEQAPLIPNEYRISQAARVQLDGDLKEWSENYQLPSWLLGSTKGAADAKIWFAWSPDGIYGAVEVKNSRASVPNPKEFWAGDVLELFISTQADKRQNAYQSGDHQFWLMPLLKENRVYVGQWKVKTEIPETRYDIQGIKSFCRKTETGYLMEFYLPASVFQNYTLAAGRTIALNANLTVRSATEDREVFWPRSKETGVNMLPLNWGRMKLD